jgi:uncharacterized protein YbaR (Trm112 family)
MSANSSFDATTLATLACPACHGDLRTEGMRLVCTSCHRAYPILDGIPVLIPGREESSSESR